MDTEHVETVIVGGGQAGLATAYYLRRRGVPFAILDAEERVGDVWRHRWDSLRLFTYARYAGLPGLRFPAPAWSFPSKDDMADYLETYARTFEFDVRSGVRVESLSREGRSIRADDARPPVRGGQRRRRDRVAPGPEGSAVRRRPRSLDRAAPLQRVPATLAIARRRRPARRRGQLRRRHRDGRRARPPDVVVGP